MDQFLKDENIMEIIKDYINSENTDYAIMIDGAWGSGKTYFVLKKLKEYLKEFFKSKDAKLKFIYISTYGVKSCSELDNKIHDKIIIEFLPEKLKDKFKNIENAADSLYKIVKEFKKWPDISKDNIRNLVDILQKKKEKNYIMIFDDIERCDMPINSLLGYINEFVEHKDMKVILIANEKEIEKKKIYTDLELKYLAAVNDNLLIPCKKEKKENFFAQVPSNGENKKMDIDDLNERVKTLFGEDLLYKQIKEKLVGITIYYRPELDNILMELVNKQVKDEKTKEYIKDNKEKILRIMNDKNHINIRTLKFAILLIEKIFKVIFEVDLSSYEENNIQNCKINLLMYIVYACIKYKKDLLNMCGVICQSMHIQI